MKLESLSEQLMFNTVRLETTTGVGTGFFYKFKRGKEFCPAIITNKHVVDNKEEQCVKFSLHLKDPNGVVKENVVVSFNAHWYFHPTKDLCFTLVDLLFAQVKKECGKDVFCIFIDSTSIPTEETLEDLSALEEVAMVGYPIGLSDEKNNYPIFRKGYTASHPVVDFNGDGIGLVDMACFPGSSGSPIYILNEGFYCDKHGKTYLQSRAIFLGVLYSSVYYDVKGKIVESFIPSSTENLETYTSVMANLGCYVKAAEINKLQTIVEQLNEEEINKPL